MAYKRMTAFLALLAVPGTALANNACTVPAIETLASVKTSYDAEYDVRTTYRTPNEMVTQFIRSTPTTLAVEGALTWTRNDAGENIASDAERGFAIGHQHHAMLLHFDDIMSDIQVETELSFNGQLREGRTGTFPTGGRVSLVDGTSPDQPAGLIMLLPDESPISVIFDDWRSATNSKVKVPFQVTINHEENIFNYTYSQVEFEAMDSVDLQHRYGAPSLDSVQVQRLHRALLAAHCRGDNNMMADLSAPSVTIANRGEVTNVSPEDTRSRFESVFSQIDYTGYLDVADPIIQISESGDIGWAIVNVRAEGHAKSTGQTFSQQWAWVMLAEKRDGVWVYTGNASNAVPAE